MPKALVLLSGGLDSTVTLALALEHDDVVKCVHFAYGQTHMNEVMHALRVAEHYKVPMQTVPVLYSHIKPTNETGALLDNELDQNLAATTSKDKIGEQVSATFVPGRNIVFLALAGGICDSEHIDHIYIGVNSVDYSGYPDCRPHFINAMHNALNEGLRRKITIFAPLIHKTKGQIIEAGIKLNAPQHLTWSCYAGQERPCGICPSCKVRANGFAEAGIPDPAL